MVTKEYSSANAEINPMEKFETVLHASNKILNNVAQSNQSVKRTVDDATRKFFASHDHLSKEIKDFEPHVALTDFDDVKILPSSEAVKNLI